MFTENVGFNFSATQAAGGSGGATTALKELAKEGATGAGLGTGDLLSKGWFSACSLGVLETATGVVCLGGGVIVQAGKPNIRIDQARKRITDEEVRVFWDLKRPVIGEWKGVSLGFLRNDRKRPLMSAAFKKALN